MLKMIHGRQSERTPANQEMIYVKDAAWPVPFETGLEYNSPCHGPWNIVHIGMAVPGSHQIYVCGANCNRGVVLTAAEMKLSHRYSTLTLFEDDLINGDMESLIIGGVSEILNRLDNKPGVLFLFTVCVHRFMGLDLDYVYWALERAFPDIIFVRSFMEPISQKHGLTPEQRLRDGMHSFLPAGKTDSKHVSIIGSDFKIEETSELKKLLRGNLLTVTESSACEDLDQYMSMGESCLFICCYPTALHAVKKLSERLDRPYIYLPASFSYDEIDEQLSALKDLLGRVSGINKEQAALSERSAAEKLKAACDRALEGLFKLVGDTAIAIDASAVPRYLGLARLLISHGFNVVRLYGDVFSPEERGDYEWLVSHAPDLTICPTIHPAMRVFKRGQEEKVLAVGQKAAYFHQTPYFVNIVQGAGLHGYDGILRLVNMMREAFLSPKDTKDLVGRKGLGCESY